MSRLFSIHETAEAEIHEAADFYDLEAPGLGSGFLDEVERAIEAISQRPEAAPLVRGGVRRKPLRRFPYSFEPLAEVVALQVGGRTSLAFFE